ncbi:hypothetical protein predicted by Glimmer/Critica [Helicobacter pylori B8]|uniref:Uncharacterized protein n=1 Tax=Helicobacter pylori (strain B8) TaxID=693745 RepID=D7FD59_HELP3|nr:hypothetical protein predicted by Glimmer/Critica [Helicobacter pylori B8]
MDSSHDSLFPVLYSNPHFSKWNKTISFCSFELAQAFL